MRSLYRGFITLFLYISISIFFFLNTNISLQAQTIYGKVVENSPELGDQPLSDVTLSWLNEETGSITDENGIFKLPFPQKQPARLVVRLIGYRTDTLTFTELKDTLFLTLSRKSELKTVEIIARQKGTIISSVETQKVELLTRKEFTKAACCNLSESFETNATVDVSYSDAVTGIKEVQMLGLAGIYTQITKGNQPMIRGLGRPLGMNYIPGTWLNAVQVLKGTGSVVNGYESIAGQINIDLLEPHRMKEKWLFNIYGNINGRTEGNIVTKWTLGNKRKWYGNLFLHSSMMQNKMDKNNDGFLDMPLYTQFNVANHWKYEGIKGFEGQFGFQIVQDEIKGGQINFEPEKHKLGKEVYGLGIKTQRVEVFSKTGKVFQGKSYKSVGLQLMGIYHKQDSYFGSRPYMGDEKNFNANLIYQTKFLKEENTFKAGVSYTYDRIEEHVDSNSHFLRTESVPGIFSELTIKKGSRWSAVGGLRLDAHNLFGLFITPRLHLKYGITDKLTLRAGGGRGYRVINLYPENLNLLTSARQIIREESFKPEIAWNYGLSLTQNITLFDYDGSISLDLYRTDFENQIVIDMDSDQQKAYAYNLRGKSFSNTAQIQWNQEWFEGFETRLAYKLYDVQTDFMVGRLDKALIARHRIFTNISYEIGRFTFDFTLHIYGPKRLPRTDMNPEAYQRPSQSPTFAVMNAQVSYKVKEWDFYIGGENIGNFRQNDPILGAREPFGSHFDTSFVWGPILGSIYYAGIRFKILDKTVCQD